MVPLPVINWEGQLVEFTTSCGNSIYRSLSLEVVLGFGGLYLIISSLTSNCWGLFWLLCLS